MSITIFSIYNPRTLRSYTTYTTDDNIHYEISRLRDRVRSYLNGSQYIDDLTLKYHPFLSILLTDTYETEIHEVIANSERNMIRIDTLVAYNNAMMVLRLQTESVAEPEPETLSETD